MTAIVRHLRNVIQKFALFFLAGVVVFSFFSQVIVAQESVGSLALSDLNKTLLNQSIKLEQEINLALKEVKKDDVGCTAPMIFSASSELHHARFAPFSCYFSKNKTLTIQARNIVKLPNGETVPLEQLLKNKSIPQEASLAFELTSWKWSDKKEQEAK